MKYNVIGDIHGRTEWIYLVQEDAVNIFVGDYFSPYDKRITFEDCKRNFLDICEYKKKHWDNTILLIGNHDEDHWHICEGYSRHDFTHEDEIHDLFEMHKGLFQAAYSIENKILVTHAGVSYVWYEHYKNNIITYSAWNLNYNDPDEIESPYTHEKVPYENPIKYLEMASVDEAFDAFQNRYAYKGITPHNELHEGTFVEWNDALWRYTGNKFVKYDPHPDEIAEFINNLWLRGEYSAFNFNSNSMYGDYCGDSATQGPMWIRVPALLTCNIFSYSPYKQVFGHTISSNIEHYTYPGNVYKGQMYMIDCLEKTKESLLIEYDDRGVEHISHYKI